MKLPAATGPIGGCLTVTTESETTQVTIVDRPGLRGRSLESGASWTQPQAFRPRIATTSCGGIGNARCGWHLRWTIHGDGNDAVGQNHRNDDWRVSNDGFVCPSADSIECSGKPTRMKCRTQAPGPNTRLSVSP